MRLIPTAILLIVLSSQASALDIGKPFKKATQWVAIQSGVKPTSDNINAANNANNPAQRAEDVEKAKSEVALKTNDTLDSVKNASDNASITMTLLRWPLFVSSVFLCLWIFGRAIHSWRTAFAKTPTA